MCILVINRKMCLGKIPHSQMPHGDDDDKVGPTILYLSFIYFWLMTRLDFTIYLGKINVNLSINDKVRTYNINYTTSYCLLMSMNQCVIKCVFAY